MSTGVAENGTSLPPLRGIGWPRARWRWFKSQFVRFSGLSPLRLIADLQRARRLNHGRIEMPEPVNDKGPERVVVSLTTIPERVAHLQPVLAALLEQDRPPDRVILALPEVSLRSGKPYPLPERLPDGVDILRCEDTGPSSKLLPALRAEPKAHIIVADDDVIYPRDFISTLLRRHRAAPEAAIGLRGWCIEPEVEPRHYEHVWGTALKTPKQVDILLGTWGYLIPPASLDDAVHDYSGYPDAMRWVDDVWVSGHLARLGIARMVVPSRGFPLRTRTERLHALTFGLNRSGLNDRIAVAAMSRFW
ncbi:MAG: glycosyltransferase family 2 protein [Rhodobiaceae bacterium]|nr:glycosyltransferase family 2 protein [Rhodobiaceae bacterium]MCC0054628.1 glycosyltransferase family 2 protein [Rhodobiaceae bacterium]